MAKSTVASFLVWDDACVCAFLAVSIRTMVLLRCWGVKGALVPRWGLAEAHWVGSGDYSVPFKCGSATAEQVT